MKQQLCKGLKFIKQRASLFLHILILMNLVGAVGVVSAQDMGQDTPTVTSLRVGNHPDKIRVVLDMTGPVKHRWFMLESPYRIVVDTSRVNWQLPETTNSTHRGVLKAYRFGLYQPNVSRLVLDLNAPAVVSQTLVLEPADQYGWRLVLDLSPSTEAEFKAEVQRTATAPTDLSYEAPVQKAPQLERVARADAKKIIVLDAGHGGVDPGALAISGLREKDLVLDVAKRTKKELEASGKFHVILTRSKDVYVPLRDRVQIAQNAGADLFISLHADSFRDAKVNGASVYTLSDKASDKEAELLAQRENKSDIIAGVSLEGYSTVINNILIDLAQRDTMNQSVVFARDLIPQLGKSVRMRKNPKRAAGFVVLKAPDVPSVLVELGYLSNAKDAARISSPAGQVELARSIRAGVMDYFFGQAF